jgi:thioredoxin 1
MTTDLVESNNFEAEVLKSDLPVLVYFWATWCTTCKAFSPRINTLAEQAEGRFKVVKIEAAQQPELVERYNVMGLPTTLLFKPGQAPIEVTFSTYNKDWAGHLTTKYLS